MKNHETKALFGGNYTGAETSAVVDMHNVLGAAVTVEAVNRAPAAADFVAGVSEVDTLTFADQATSAHGDYVAITDTNGDKWAVALSKGGTAEQTTITCIAEGTVAAVAEQTSVVAIADTGVKERTQIVCRADSVPDPIDQRTVILRDHAGSVGVWFDSDGAGTAPAEALACTRQLKVTVSPLDTAGTIGTALYAALDGDSKFVGISDDTAGTIVVEDIYSGVRTHASASTSGFTVTTPAVGVASNLNGKYFVLNDEGGSVGVWIDTDDMGTSAPTTGCTRNLEVTTIVTGDSASTIGGKLRTAIDADSKFNQSGSGATCVAVNIATQALAQHGNAGTSGFTVTTTVNGVTAVASALQSKYFVLGDTDASSTVGVWFNINSGGSVPAGASACSRQLAITTISAGDTAAQVAAKVRTAIDNDSKFDVGTLVNATFNAICKDLVAVADSSAGDSGFTVVTAVQGTVLGAEPTGAIWAAIPAAKKTQANIYPDSTAANVASRVRAALVGLTGIGAVVTVGAANGADVPITHVARGVVANPVPKNADDSGAGTITVAETTPGINSSVGVLANTIAMTAHGYVTGLKGQLTVKSGGGTLPTGVTTGTDYFVIAIDANTISLAASLADALAGTAINITGQGTTANTFTFTATSLAGCSVHLEGSVDGIVWIDITSASANITATSNAWIHLTNAYYHYMRAVLAMTAGQVGLTCNVAMKEAA